jgi:hypothetical protein
MQAALIYGILCSQRVESTADKETAELVAIIEVCCLSITGSLVLLADLTIVRTGDWQKAVR